MTHLIQSVLTMLRGWEWMPVTAARVLIGIFFCISGGTKLFVKAQFGVVVQTMVQITLPFPHASALFVIDGRIRVRRGPGDRVAHTAVRRNAYGRHDRRGRHQSHPQHPGEPVSSPGSTISCTYPKCYIR